MAKLATIEYDDTGRATVTHTELPPQTEETTEATTMSSPKKRVPSSPHKPFTSANFYDLTKSDSPDISPVSTEKESSWSVPTVKDPSRSISSGFRALQEVDRENIIPGPFAKPIPSTNTGSAGFRKGASITDLTDMIASHFIDPGTLLPANSPLWKSSKVDVRKPSGKSSFTAINRAPSKELSGVPSFGPSRATATPISMPSNPPRPFPFKTSSFINPESIAADIPSGPLMSTEEAEEALKQLFESPLIPEDEEKETKEEDGKIEGLHVTLMKHQIEGLAFLQDHESNDDKVKGKGKYGGILADDVPSTLLRISQLTNRWVLEKPFKH